MKMKNIEMINIIDRLEKFINKETQVPYKVRRAIVKNRQALVSEYSIYDAERSKLRDSLGKKKENMTEQEKKVYKEKEEEVNAKIAEILNEEVDIDIIKISESDLDIDTLTIKDLIALDFMVADGEEKKE